MRQIRESNIEKMTTMSGQITSDVSDSEETRMLKRIRQAEELIRGIAEIIFMQMPLKHQDEWLERVKATGIWTPDPDIVEGAKDGDD